MTRIFQAHLRTSDIEAARAFYAAFLGDQALQIFKLHEQAVARGARPHWLGYIDVADVDQASAAFLERGATPLGPKWINPEGLEAAVMRDPGGAVIALAKPLANAKPCGPEVDWYLLNTVDVERAKINYQECFGWDFKPPIDLGSLGILHPFSWQLGQAAVGAMSDIATRTGVHPHWLFHFRVPALEPAMEAIRAAGGTVLAPVILPSGERIAVCDDPQGAAFAIR